MNGTRNLYMTRRLSLSEQSSQYLLRWKSGCGYAFLRDRKYKKYYKKFCLDFITFDGRYYLTMGRKTIVLTDEQAKMIGDWAVER